MSPNRYRKKLATTVDPDTYWLVCALSDLDRKGHFLDEAIHAYMTNCHWFSFPEGGLQLRCPGNFYHFVDYNDEQQSPEFKSMIEALYWLKNTYPDANRIFLPEGEEKTLF